MCSSSCNTYFKPNLILQLAYFFLVVDDIKSEESNSAQQLSVQKKKKGEIANKLYNMDNWTKSHEDKAPSK